MMIRNRCAFRRIPTTLLALCSSAYQASTFKKECDDVDAAARTKPRVSPSTRRGAEKRGTPDALQEGMAAPMGVTASVSAFRQGFLLTPKKPRPRHSIALHQTRRPPACATTIMQSPPPSHRDQSSETDGNGKGHPETRSGWTADTREGTTSSANGGYRPDAATGADQALWPGQARGLVKLPSPRCSRHATIWPPPAQATSPAAGSGIATARPGPPRPKWAQRA
jgi:hypothetical protein